MKRIMHVVGARPNFVKMAPVFRALSKFSVNQFVVHTGQHYSENMSAIFFEQLQLQPPDVNLNVSTGT